MQKAFLVLAFAPLLMGGACEKKTAKAGDDPRPAVETGEVDSTPLPGIDVSKLDSDKQHTFYRLVGSLTSPCGKQNESLRKAFASDTSCKRAPFAVRYLLSMLEDDANPQQAEDEYNRKYKPAGDPVKLDVSRAPHIGTEDAPVRLVEFYDYGCPHCQLFAPVLEKVADDEQGKVVIYFMQYPLEKHPDSRSAAAAALAANAQGKFKEMHELLFAKQPEHNREHVMEYAKQLGLDMGKFEQDYAAFAAQVQSDYKQGEAALVEATPTLFFNNRKYEGPMNGKKYIEMWIDEELAVNR